MIKLLSTNMYGRTSNESLVEEIVRFKAVDKKVKWNIQKVGNIHHFLLPNTFTSDVGLDGY